MNKKKSKVLAFLLAASLLIPSVNGIVSAAELESKNIVAVQGSDVDSSDKSNAISEVKKVNNATDLKNAFDNAPTTGETIEIVLESNITDFSQNNELVLKKGKNIILNMNGKKINVTSDFQGAVINNQANLIIKGNGVIDASLSNNGSNQSYPIRNSGNLVIENGIYKSTNNRNVNGATIINGGKGTLEINGGEISEGKRGLSNAPDSKVTINNGIIKGWSVGLISDGEVDIKGGKINAPLAIENMENMNIYGGEFNGESALYNNGGTVNIRGGNFRGNACSQCTPNNYPYAVTNGLANNTGESIMNIYGGTFVGIQGALSAVYGTVSVYGGDFKTVACTNHQDGSSAYYALYVNGDVGKVTCNINGGTFESVSKVAAYIGNNKDGENKKESIAIFNNGTFISGDKDKVINVDKQTSGGNLLGSLLINGGEYNGTVKDYVNPGLKAELVSSNGMRSYYPTVEEALNNADSGSTVVDLENKNNTNAKKVTLNYNDGSGKVIDISENKDGKVTLPELKRSGYTFLGWDDGTKPYKKGEYLLNGKDVSLKAVWEKNGSGSGSSGSGGVISPTYTHEEIIGSDRYDTAAKIADKLGSYDNVVLVNAESSMSDGLSASGLAGKENGAILLTKKDSIPKVTMDRIKKVKKVYIIGGEAAISQKVSDEITKNVPNVKVERLGGKDRVETSEIVAKKLGNYSDAFVVNGFKGEADAMSASSVAAREEAPILLTNGKTSTHAKKSGVKYYVIGGNSVVDKSIADKYNAEVLAGKDRYATNKEVINEFYSGSDKVYIANGDKLVDALTASPLAKKDGIVLVNEKSDKSILKGKDTVQVGGMDFKIEFEK